MKKSIITAHSGCEGTPDNSMGSIMTGIELGADCVEIDIRMDAYGKLWLTHDIAGSFDGILSLEEAFTVIAKAGIAVNCDLKEYPALFPTIAMADKCGVKHENLIFSGQISPAFLTEHPEVAQRARIFINSEEIYMFLASAPLADHPTCTRYISENIAKVADCMRAIGTEALNAPYKHMPDTLIAALHSADIKLSLWTVNDDENLSRLLSMDIHNITTRTVRSALRLSKKRTL